MNKCPVAIAYGTCQLQNCRECHGKDGLTANIVAWEFARSRQPGTVLLGSNGPAEIGEMNERGNQEQ